MKKEDKKPLEKLAKLENPKTEAFLSSKAIEIYGAIHASKNNDEIFELLDLIDAFAYRVGDTCIKIAASVISSKYEAPIHRSPIGRFRGKSHKDLVLKTLEILNGIRYAKPDELLKLSTNIVQGQSDPDIRKKTLDIIKNLSKFDFFILTKTKIGYGAQRKVLDHILAWSTEERLLNFDIVETITTELLSCEFEGSEWTKEDTLTFHSGAINPSDFLKAIRKQTIDLLKDIYIATDDVKIRIRVIHALEGAVRSPASVAYSDELAEMLKDDSIYLVQIFREFIFGNKTTLTDNLSAAKEVDVLLYWFKRHSKYTSPEATQLRKDILTDPLYSIFRTLVADDVTYREEEGWNNAENKRGDDTQRIIDSINRKNLSDWQEKLNKIAEQNRYVERWTFMYFKDFLRKLTSQKPEMSKVLFTNAFDESRPLKDFTGAFLEGFRDTKRFEDWDAFVSRVVETSDPNLVSAICYSLIRTGNEVKLSEEIRQADIDLLEKIVMKSGEFSFLKEEKERNYILHHSIINALASNFSRDPKQFEKMIILEVGKNPDYTEIYLRELPFAVWRKYIDFSTFTAKGVKFLQDKLIEIRDLHWEAQQLLLDLGKNDLEIIIDVFMGRIMRDVKQKTNRKRNLDRAPSYDAIPYHLNDGLRKHVAEHPQYKESMLKHLKDSTPEWSVYNWDLGEFLERIGTSFSEILMTLIEKKDKTGLRRAVYLMNSIEGSDLNLCIEIVRRTDDKKVLSKIDAMLYSTGVVSGEDGIARAYEAKAKQLEHYVSDKSPRVKKYVKRMISSFNDSAKREFARAEERKQIRKIEFEG